MTELTYSTELSIALDIARHSRPELTANIYAKSRDDRLKDLADKIGNVVLSDDLRANSVQWRSTP